MIADSSAATTVTWVMARGSTMPFPTVVATAVPEIAPTKLNTPAIITATNGDRTRVPTMVAMALAASWNPFTNSNKSPRMTMTASSRNARSTLALLQDNRLEGVGHVLGRVDGAFQSLQYVLPFNDVEWL